MGSAQAYYSLWQLMIYFLRLGALGLGGPVALIGYMYKDLVEQRGWFSNTDYKEGLALSQIAPGPLATQLAIYLGYVHYRILGATVVSIAFISPAFLMVLVLGWAYTTFGSLPWMQAVFYGVSAALVGIMAISAYKLTTQNIGPDKLLWGVFTILAVITVITQSETVWLFISAGGLVWLKKCKPKLSLPKFSVATPIPFFHLLPTVNELPILLQITLFFIKAGAFVFGSGLAIVPFLYSGIVTEHHWLTDKQFVDAIAVAMITPGPVVITTAFIGYLVAGVPGASLAALATFMPCYLITLVAAPHFQKQGKKPGLVAFVSGITAAAMGAIVGSVVILAQRAITDVPTTILATSTAILLWKIKKIPEPLIIITAALLGFWIYPLWY